MRYPRIFVLGLVALVALLAVVLAASASGDSVHRYPLTAEASSPPRSRGLIPGVVGPQAGDGAAPERLSLDIRSLKNPKMSSHVARLAQAQREARTSGQEITALNLSPLDPDLQAMAKARLMRIDGQGRLQAYVLVATTADKVVAEVEGAGGQVERLDQRAGIVQALVPLGQLEAVAARSSVKFIRLPDYGFPGAGSVTTEGDPILGADLVRSAFAVDGTGVSIGVISDGVGGLAASQASADLPAVNTATCNVIPGSDPTLSGAEGTAMLEIVHDLAPGAELWFGHFGFPGTSLAFNAAVDCLAANTDVVVDDIGWFNVGSYDGTSIVSANTSTELNRASNPIRAYATAVGNQADKHYQEAFVDSGFDLDVGGGPLWDFHRFQATSNTSDAGLAMPCDLDSPSILCTDSVLVADGGFVVVFLQWNDPFGGSNNDYDLFLFDFVEDDPLVAVGWDVQDGTQDPVEWVGWANDSGQDRWFDVVIGNHLGTAASRTFDMFVICDGCALLPNDAIHNFNTQRSSVPNQSDAGGGVISAGAINASDPGNDTIAFYSSRGPTNDNRIKPDITGIDCVTVTGAGGFGSPFCGTSAAAPHIAGIAALLLECSPGLLAGEPGDGPQGDRTSLRDALLNNAVDLAPAGVDNTYGYGRADALASATAICDSTPFVIGDVDCDEDVDAVDALFILQNVAGLRAASNACPPPTASLFEGAADADCDEDVDAVDALFVLQHVAGLRLELCPP